MKKTILNESSLLRKLHTEDVTHYVRTDSAITLIALVVTIIVLLILAGVAINLVAGGDGIMAKAQNAINLSNEAEAKERVNLKIAEFKTDFYNAVYVEKSVSVNVKFGDWIAQEYAGEVIKAGAYEFTISGTNGNYTITILENNRLKNDIIGTMNSNGKVAWNDDKTGSTGNSVVEAKKSVVQAVLSYQDEFYEEVYVDQTTSVNTEFGDWMAENYGDQEITAGDHTFEISGQAAPYSLRVMKSANLDEEIEGQMSEQGKVTWTESGNTNAETTADAQDTVAQANSEYKNEYYKAVYIDQTVSTNVGYGDWLAENYGGQELSADDYTYQISGSVAPYAVRLNKSGSLSAESLGQMDSNGNITWVESDSEGNQGGTENPGTEEPAPESPTKYTVTYDANRGTGSVPATSEYEEGTTVTVNFATVPTREGFLFLGWSEDASATTATYTSAGTTNFTVSTSNVMLYAVWEEIKYTVTYNANGGTGSVPASGQYSEGEKITLSTTSSLTKSGYNFLGWATTENATQALTSYTVEKKNLTLYAVWEKVMAEIKIENYGDYVDLGTNLIVKNKIALADGKVPTTDWRIFHKDTSGGVYLMLADFLPTSYESTVGSGLKLYGASYPYLWSGKSRTDLLTKLANSSAWNNLIDSSYISKGITVIGAIDIEKWVESWNSKGYERLYVKKTTTGYYASTDEDRLNIDTDAILEFGDGYNNSLYFPHKDSTTIKDTWGYWLAAGSAKDADSAYYITYEGYLYVSRYSGGLGVRPTVYIPAGIEMEQNETTGIWSVIID